MGGRGEGCARSGARARSCQQVVAQCRGLPPRRAHGAALTGDRKGLGLPRPRPAPRRGSPGRAGARRAGVRSGRSAGWRGPRRPRCRRSRRRGDRTRGAARSPGGPPSASARRGRRTEVRGFPGRWGDGSDGSLAGAASVVAPRDPVVPSSPHRASPEAATRAMVTGSLRGGWPASPLASAPASLLVAAGALGPGRVVPGDRAHGMDVAAR